jgi:hypothetical protein
VRDGRHLEKRNLSELELRFAGRRDRTTFRVEMHEDLELVAFLCAFRDLAPDEQDDFVLVDREERARRTEPPDREPRESSEEIV